VKKGIALFAEQEMLPVIGVSKVFQHPELMLREVDGYLESWMDLGKRKERSQDLQDLFVPNGNFYLISVQNLRESKSFFQPISIPLLASSVKEGLDIDTPEDFEIAELMIRVLK
jgi:CMP-N-acetylneuraminic acid synthetase